MSEGPQRSTQSTAIKSGTFDSTLVGIFEAIEDHRIIRSQLWRGFAGSGNRQRLRLAAQLAEARGWVTGSISLWPDVPIEQGLAQVAQSIGSQLMGRRPGSADVVGLVRQSQDIADQLAASAASGNPMAADRVEGLVLGLVGAICNATAQRDRILVVLDAVRPTSAADRIFQRVGALSLSNAPVLLVATCLPFTTVGEPWQVSDLEPLDADAIAELDGAAGQTDGYRCIVELTAGLPDHVFAILQRATPVG